MEKTLDDPGKENRKANPEAFRRDSAKDGTSRRFTVAEVLLL